MQRSFSLLNSNSYIYLSPNFLFLFFIFYFLRWYLTKLANPAANVCSWSCSLWSDLSVGEANVSILKIGDSQNGFLGLMFNHMMAENYNACPFTFIFYLVVRGYNICMCVFLQVLVVIRKQKWLQLDVDLTINVNNVIIKLKCCLHYYILWQVSMEYIKLEGEDICSQLAGVWN